MRNITAVMTVLKTTFAFIMWQYIMLLGLYSLGSDQHHWTAADYGLRGQYYSL